MKIVSLVLKIVFFIITLIVFLPAKLAYIGGEDQKTWQDVEATVLKSELGVRTPKEDSIMDSDTYFWDVKYKYSYKDLSFEREGIYVNTQPSTGSKSKYMLQIKENPVGAKITAYVNPEKPDQAYLFRRTEGAIETTYKFTKYLMYFALFLFFTPLIRKIFKIGKGKNSSQAPQPSVQQPLRQNYSRPTQTSSTSQSDKNTTSSSEDGFDF